MVKFCGIWHAWINRMPPPPDDFHVVGDVEVGNPGVEALLTMKVPQGINPAILLLDLNFVQKPGIWPQVLTCVQARFDRVLIPGSTPYTAVEIFHQGQRVLLIDHVDIVV